MKRYDYYRPSAASLGKKRRVVRRQKGPSFFLRLLVLFLFVSLLAGGGFAVWKGYQFLVTAKLADWKPKEVVVTGVTGEFHKNILALVQPAKGKPFSVKDAVALRDQILTKYPMLKNVSVKRGLVKGVLTVDVLRREPVAKFVMPDQTLKFIDKESTIYTDPNPNTLHAVASIELEGEIPERLSPELVDLVESTLKLKRDLEFSALRMNLTQNTIKLFTPDGCEVDFGQAVELKKKAARAAQILGVARERYSAPFVLKFDFFDDGKVFLTAKSA